MEDIAVSGNLMRALMLRAFSSICEKETLLKENSRILRK